MSHEASLLFLSRLLLDCNGVCFSIASIMLGCDGVPCERSLPSKTVVEETAVRRGEEACCFFFSKVLYTM